MKKIGIITFHAAHNYGSVLQAYALQKILTKMGLMCEIIDFRTERQKDQYRPLTKRKGCKYFLKNCYFLLNYRNRKDKYNKFETFIADRLCKSKREYSSLNELYSEEDQYDYYISGSDQIWNTAPNDANMAYFLPFVKSGKKIAYAPSFGQIGDIKNKNEIANYLSKYDYISVREEYGQNLINKLIGRCADIVLDPTLLMDKDDWERLVDSKPLIDGDYIFFYTLFASSDIIKTVKKISKDLKLPVVISNISNQYEIFNSFIKKTNCGPEDFLNLIKNAKLVCATSFHGTVFSVLLHKPFIALNGMNDNRISTLLRMMRLTDMGISIPCNNINYNNIFNVDYNMVDDILYQERMKSLNYLKKALDLKES